MPAPPTGDWVGPLRAVGISMTGCTVQRLVPMLAGAGLPQEMLLLGSQRAVGHECEALAIINK